MKKFRLSTDIISPIHSDISMNDSSLISFGSISDIPDFRKESESPKCESLERGSNVDSFCKTTLKESAAAFDLVVNDIKKQSNINAEKEERFKESYEILKHSMDELCNKFSHPSILSPVSSGNNFEDEIWAENMPTQKKTDIISEMPKNLKKDWGGNESTKSKTVSQISSKKSKKKEESSLRKKDKNEQSKSICLLRESTESSKHYKKKVCPKEIGMTESISVWGLQNPETLKTVSTSTQTCGYFDAVGADGKENLKNFYLQKQRKPEISNTLSATENKALSIEKTIQIAISMEMDNLRMFMLDQNLCLRKDIRKLEETGKKQREVTGYMFSVIEELIEENKKLISIKNKI